MPVINVAMGKTTPEAKKALIEQLSRTAIEITGVPASEFTVFIQEYEYESIGRAGLALPDYLKTLK
jgi:4-oxalocrotonate tautomerase